MTDLDKQITDYIESQPEPKRGDLEALHKLILAVDPACEVRFLDGKNSDGRVVSNPNIGYGSRTMKYADGSTREFYQVGLSANTAGISVYIMGMEDKEFLAETYGKSLGKANVTGYCIKFKKIEEINIAVLQSAIRVGLQTKKEPQR